MHNPRKDEITNRQIETLEVIDRYQREHGYPPTVREIAERLGVLSANAAQGLVEKLIYHGLLERPDKPGKRSLSRAMTVTLKGARILASLEIGGKQCSSTRSSSLAKAGG